MSYSNIVVLATFIVPKFYTLQYHVFAYVYHIIIYMYRPEPESEPKFTVFITKNQKWNWKIIILYNQNRENPYSPSP